MNYYPNNFYQNYQPQQVMPIPQLPGKVVDSIDIVKTTEVPFGSYGIFPKGDLSEVYIKSWNNNGTTQINTYKAIVSEEKKDEVDANALLLERIESIEKKIDLLTGQKSIPEKKEMSSSAY